MGIEEGLTLKFKYSFVYNFNFLATMGNGGQDAFITAHNSVPTFVKIKKLWGLRKIVDARRGCHTTRSGVL